MDRLIDLNTSSNISSKKERRLIAIARTIVETSPDILCVLEGPVDVKKMRFFCSRFLKNQWKVIEDPDQIYGNNGNHHIWFIVKRWMVSKVNLLPIQLYKNLTSHNWKVNYWDTLKVEQHTHYRHPQLLRVAWKGVMMDFVGVHIKPKFKLSDREKWNENDRQKIDIIKSSIKDRIKLSTEAQNIRSFIDSRFQQDENPALFVVGGVNEGPGKELIEKKYFHSDLISNIQGDVYSASKYLNHALFDQPENLKWTVNVTDYVDPDRNPKILLDHILFTQSVVDGSLPIRVNKKAGFIEHEVFERINMINPKYAYTSDHRPVSLFIDHMMIEHKAETGKDRHQGFNDYSIAAKNMFYAKNISYVDEETNDAEEWENVQEQLYDLLRNIAGDDIDPFDRLDKLVVDIDSLKIQIVELYQPALNITDLEEIEGSSTVDELVETVLRGLGL